MPLFVLKDLRKPLQWGFLRIGHLVLLLATRLPFKDRNCNLRGREGRAYITQCSCVVSLPLAQATPEGRLPTTAGERWKTHLLLASQNPHPVKGGLWHFRHRSELESRTFLPLCHGHESKDVRAVGLVFQPYSQETIRIRGLATTIG